MPAFSAYLSVLCDSAVKEPQKHINRRDAEDRRDTQRKLRHYEKAVCFDLFPLKMLDFDA